MIHLRNDIEKALTTQDYTPSRNFIADVRKLSIRRFLDKSGAGSMMEIFSDIKDIKQVNYSEMPPGAIKAFHLHKKQTDYWFVPPSSKMLLVLFECRDGKPFPFERMILGPDPQVIEIPPGVAHGVKNVGLNDGVIIYGVTERFDPVNPDEHRLPWNYLGEDIWEMDRE